MDKKQLTLTCEKCGEKLELNYDSDIFSLINDNIISLSPANKLDSSVWFMHKKCGGHFVTSQAIKLIMDVE